MKLKKLRCTNCDGPLTEANGKYWCESCGTSYVIDMDPEDVEYEKMKRQDAVRDNHEPIQRSSNNNRNRSNTTTMAGTVVTVITIACVFFLRGYTGAKQRKLEESRASMSIEMSEHASEFSAAAESMLNETFFTTGEATTATTIDDSAITGNSEFCAQLKDKCDYLIVDQVFAPIGYEKAGEPQYIGSYLLTPDSSVYGTRIEMIYMLTWTNGDSEEQVYVCIDFSGVKIAEDGSCDYERAELTGHFVTINDVIFQGYDDLDALIAEQVDGRTFYTGSELAIG